MIKRIIPAELLRLFFPVIAMIWAILPVKAQLTRSSNFIHIPRDAGAEVKTSAEDMAYWLQKSTGKKFTVQTGNHNPSQGIVLTKPTGSDLSSADRKQLESNGQSFHLLVRRDGLVKITGTGTNSFINGIYTFLHELGFRWYMPGDNWAHYPKFKGWNVEVNRVYTPSFLSRSYFGTGGIGPIPGLDDKNSFKKDFDDWNRRNRLNTEFDGKGHIGQVFYNENKAILDKNPSWFCGNTVNRYGRIDIANSKAVDLFVNWALGKINYKDRHPMVGVDPADGSAGKDDCLPKGMKGIETWSDKYFYLANAVAKKLENDKTGARVQIYAYATHAEPPDFDVHQRVYPIIIPYAFQRVKEPDEFIELWSKKLGGRAMGIYDYWNITQWSKCIPQFNIYDIPARLKLWKQYNIDFVRIESTNAKGPMGHAWWLAAQMMWDVNQPFETLYNEFLENNFGAAAADIRKMYDRWSLRYQHAMEVGFSTSDLQNAAAMTKDECVQERINELKAYVLYLDKYYRYESEPTVARYNELIQYINSIHHLRLLQTRPLQVLYIKAPEGYAKSDVEMKIEKKNTAVKPLKSKEIEKKFSQLKTSSTNLYRLSDFQFDIRKIKPVTNNKDHYNPLYINGTNSYQFYLPARRKLELQLGATEPTRYYIKDESGKKWIEGSVPGSKTGYEKINVELPAGIYTFQFGELYRFSRFIFPKDIVLVSSDTYYDNYQYPVQYFYVPAGVTEIIYRDEIGITKNNRGYWISPSGQKMNPEKIQTNVYRVKVASGQDGKIWKFDVGHRSYAVLNIPGQFSLNPFEYQK